MPAQPKYPEELRERAVKMVLEIRDREGEGWAASWVFIRRRCGPGSGRPKSTAGRGPARRRRIRGGSPSWNARCVSCAV
jgi:hypothetical protein